MQADHQPWEGCTVDRLEGVVDEVMLSTTLTKVNLCRKLDEEDGAIGEGVPTC